MARRSRIVRSFAVGLTVFIVGILVAVSLAIILRPVVGDSRASLVAAIVILGTIVAMGYIWDMLPHFSFSPHPSRGSPPKSKEQQAQHREGLHEKESVLEYLCSMDGREFERFLASFFREQGYGVTETPASADQGADLLLYKEERRIAVQAKQWEASVGNKAVHEAHVGRTFYHTYEAWVITTSGFTKAAVDAARNLSVRLIGGEELASWISTTSRKGSQTGR